MSEAATQISAGNGRGRARRRTPKFLIGVRRVAMVLTVLAWAGAVMRVTSGTASVAEAAVSAAVDTAIAWALYLAIGWFSTHPPASLMHWFRAVLKARQRRDHSEMSQIVNLVSWVAAVASVLLVMTFPDAQANGKEFAVALLLAVVVSVGAVRLVGWILRGFVRSE